jgi:hypothetical protein
LKPILKPCINAIIPARRTKGDGCGHVSGDGAVIVQSGSDVVPAADGKADDHLFERVPMRKGAGWAIEGLARWPKTVGQCQAITEATNTARWGVSPNGELFYARASDVIDAVEEPGTDMAAAKKAESGPVTVRVTRGSGSTAVTTSYTVPRTSSN